MKERIFFFLLNLSLLVAKPKAPARGLESENANFYSVMKRNPSAFTITALRIVKF